jgi:pyocin large subunit-like protein
MALALLLAASAGCGAASPPATPHAASAEASPRSGLGFRSPALLQLHYDKHGREFGDVTREQYLRIAQDLRDRPVGGDVLEIVRGDGVVSRFDRRTGTFLAFDPDGVIRTCFRPNDGERYFRRQAMRSGRGR